MKKLRVCCIAAALLGTALVSGTTVGAAPVTEQCPTTAGAVKVEAGASPATISVIDAATGTPISVIVTITGSTFTITAADPAVTLTDASWCIKSSTRTNSGTGTTGTSASLNKIGKVQAISYVQIVGVTTRTVSACNDTATSGGEGVTTNTFDLGVTAGTFELEYEMYSVPDQLDVYYEGSLIFTTGGPVSGSDKVSINFGPGASRLVDVVVTGPDGTAWVYTLSCPVTPPS